MKLVLACAVLACSCKLSSTTPPAPPAAPNDHQLHVTETLETNGIRLHVIGTGVSIADLRLPDWEIAPIKGAADIAADLHMLHVKTRDYRTATGEATLRCNGCAIGGGPARGLGGAIGSDTTSQFAFPVYTIDRLEAHVVFAKGSADVTTWSFESKDIPYLVVTAHLDLAAALGDSRASICVRFGTTTAVPPDSSLARTLAGAGIAVDANGHFNVKLAGHLDALAPEGFGCDGAVPPLPAPTPPAEPDDFDKQLNVDVATIDDTHRTITRALFDKIVADPLVATRGVRVVPTIRDGKPDGFQFYAIRPSSLFARIGLNSGDTIRRVNGVEITTTEQALRVYTKLREATAIELDVLRRGRSIKLTISIIH